MPPSVSRPVALLCAAFLAAVSSVAGAADAPALADSAAAPAVAASASAPAVQPAAAEALPPRYAMPETEQWDLSTADGARSYRIFVHRPAGEAPPGGFPVLTVLDGNAVFGSFTEAMRSLRYEQQGRGAALLVAVGYPSDAAYDLGRRGFDLTPVPMPGARATAAAAGRNARAVALLGGQDSFLDFLLNRLRPEVARRYPVSATRQSLFGHSLGGAFALHALYARPDVFRAVVAASPSVWWNEQSLLAEERAFGDRLRAASGVPVQASLRILVGGRESGFMVDDARALGTRLAPLSGWGLRSSVRVLEDESHMSLPTAAATDALRFVLTAP